VSLKRWLIVALSFACALGAGTYVVVTSWPEEKTPAGLPILAHLALLAIALLELSARAWKIQLSAASLRVPLRFETAARASVGGDFGAAITPALTGAEPARYLILNEAGIPRAELLLVLFAELFLEAFSLAIVVVVLAIVFHGSGPMLAGVIALVGTYSIFVIGLGVAGVLLSRHNASGPPPKWAVRIGLHHGRWRVVQRSLRQLRTSIEGVRHARFGLLFVGLLSSVLHVLLRLSILPAIVYAFGVLPTTRPGIAPLVLWPLALTYGSVVAPVPAGGGFVEVAFKATVGKAIPAQFLGAALIWWRFYTFYLFIILGALAAGGTVLRALRDVEEQGDEDDGERDAGTAELSSAEATRSSGR